MDTYKNTDEGQRENILYTAKALFLELGYRKTTIALIAEKAGVSVGLVNYYFKKEEIVGQIFHDFILYIRRFLNKKLGFMIENQFQMHILFNRIFFIKIFEAPAASELYSLLREKELYLDATHDYIRSSMSAIILEFDLDIQPKMFRKLTIAEYGARKALYQDIYNSPNKEVSIEFTDFLSTISVRLAGVTPEIVDENIKHCNKLMRYIDLDNIHFEDDFHSLDEVP